jgi:hypothetical protein
MRVAAVLSFLAFTGRQSGEEPSIVPGQQRLLKFLILCYMPVGVVGAIGAYAGAPSGIFLGDQIFRCASFAE